MQAHSLVDPTISAAADEADHLILVQNANLAGVAICGHFLRIRGLYTIIQAGEKRNVKAMFARISGLNLNHDF